MAGRRWSDGRLCETEVGCRGAYGSTQASEAYGLGSTAAHACKRVPKYPNRPPVVVGVVSVMSNAASRCCFQLPCTNTTRRIGQSNWKMYLNTIEPTLAVVGMGRLKLLPFVEKSLEQPC